MSKDSLDTREKDKLSSLLENVDDIVMHKYISNLDKCLVLQQNFDVAFKVDESKLTDKDKKNLCVVGQNVRLLQIKRFVYDKNENILEKLTTVYNATSSYKNATLLMLIKCKQTETEIYLGTVCKYSNDDFVPQRQIEAFKKNFEAYFPGSEIENIEIDKIDNKKCIQDVIYSIFEKEINISTLSGIPALKNKNCFENNNFVQGFEKLIDSIKGKDCSVLIFADPIENNVREAIKEGYEEIYTSLKPFERSEYNINNSNSKTVTDSVIKGVTNTVNESLAKTNTHTITEGTSSSHTVGGSVGYSHSISVGNSVSGGLGIGGIGASASESVNSTSGINVSSDYHYMSGNHSDVSNAEGQTITNGKSKAISEQNSIANAITQTNGEGLQIHYENKTIKSILERIDKQLTRINECENFGMYNYGVYFLSPDYSTCLVAANRANANFFFY